MAFFGLFGKKKEEKTQEELHEEQQTLESGLEKSKTSVMSRIGHAIAGKSTIDDDVLDDLEEALVMSDVGVETTLHIIERVQARVARDKYVSTSELHNLLVEETSALLVKADTAHLTSADVANNGADGSDKKVPYVIMVVGVNGVGKTTTIGKMAWQFKNRGLKVVLGAADTFRAAAVEQLCIWGERVGVPVVKQGQNADPASVAFDTLQSAVAQGADVVIIDTAGRLHNKVNLMNELTKIRNVMAKVIPDAPHDVMLVLDGSTGQNAFEQAKAFTKATKVTSLAITKLDGTAKGGVVLGISEQFQIPVRYIGLGEKMTDLQVFEPESFVRTLLGGVAK